MRTEVQLRVVVLSITTPEAITLVFGTEYCLHLRVPVVLGRLGGINLCKTLKPQLPRLSSNTEYLVLSGSQVLGAKSYYAV